jgi:hypothetical protein
MLKFKYPERFCLKPVRNLHKNNIVIYDFA